MKRIVILGSTGSIGTQTIDVVRQHSQELEIVGLAVNSNVSEMLAQAREFGVQNIAAGSEEVAQTNLAAEMKEQAGKAGFYGFGMDASVSLVKLAEADIVVNALVGAAGLQASVQALRAGKVLALANKESLVVGGDIIMPLAKELDAKRKAQGTVANNDSASVLMPIDSEHGAIYQCLIGESKNEVARLWVTASGGPFRGMSKAELQNVDAKRALAHPTWNMGRKISIDSATLMNKGLEVIEAHHLFDMPYNKISVVVQPQSAIHSMVEFVDGSVKAHLGTTSMRIPIQFALSCPKRWQAPVEPLDFTKLGNLEFAAADEETFRCLALAKQAGNTGGSMPCVMNAANEVAVAAFLQGAGTFLGIAKCVEAVMQEHSKRGVQKVESIEQLQELDAWARGVAKEQVC